MAKRRSLIGWLSGAVVTALVVTLAVVSQGVDAREIPKEDPSVWVERSAGQYARVNTETAEIDTVRAAQNTSGVVQAGDVGVLFTQGFGRAHTIQAASPTDVVDDAVPAETASVPGQGAAASESDPSVARTPEGTRQVSVSADRVLFLTQSGQAYLSSIQRGSRQASAGQGALSSPELLDPLAADHGSAGDSAGHKNPIDKAASPEAYVANAAAIDERGNVAVYSHAEQAIRWFDAERGSWRGGPSNVPQEVPAEGVQLTTIAGKWVLFDAATGTLWREGSGAKSTLKVVGAARLQDANMSASDVFIADEGGLWQIDPSGKSSRAAEAQGTPAKPRVVGDQTVAAWVGSQAATLWTTATGARALEVDSTVDDLSNPEPEIRTNGTRALLSERKSGMLWTVPDGTLIPVEQWSLTDPPKQASGTVVAKDVAEQEPPVAVDDAFGARAGEPALLPVLLNDFDPNRKDVLTVVPDGLGEGLNAEFGTVSLLSDAQAIVLHPTESAKGATRFTYRITDGIAVSEPATVTVTIADEGTNTGPEWCPVEGCQRQWPSPEIAPGGTLIMPILEGWVDPEGDPMMLAGVSVVNPDDPLRALVTADGQLAVRHTDPNAAAGDAALKVKVADSRGESTERELRIRVRPGAAIEIASAASTVKVDEATLVRPLERVTGGSGSFELVDTTVQQGALRLSTNLARGTVEITAETTGTGLVNITVRDTVTGHEAVGVVRVSAVDERADFAVPPLRAFVRPLADSTVDVLAAIPGANSRALTVRSATVRDGQLRADVIEHRSVRVSGATRDGGPGRIGSADVVVSEANQSSAARLTVFQVGDSQQGPIAVADTATVRAGSVVDIPVLENDVAPPGERLVLHPEIGAPGAPGELAFASGTRLRYLAPSEPGVYTLSYTTYGASSPEQRDVGQVRVTVLPAGTNRDPQPAPVTVRVAPGETVQAVIPLSGVDPDGDRVRLVAVASPDDAQLSAALVPRSNSVQVTASASAQRGTHLVNYTVRDSFDGQAKGVLRIIVSEPDAGGGAPVVYSDYVRLARGAAVPATVRPLENDLDPAGGSLELVSVQPNVPGGEASPEYRELQSRLDLTGLKDGVVRITGGDTLGTTSFRYVVRSSTSKSTADGLIVVQVSERVGQQAPTVSDTVLSVRDRADFERSGVDVVTGRVRWAGGDASKLTLSLWGDAASHYRVKGSSIFGSYRAEGDFVPFKLAGVDASGSEVQTFGFLIVPPLDELRLTLKPDVRALSVAENKSIDVNVTDLLDLGAGDHVELDQTTFQTQRQQASCQAVNLTTIRYSAGKGAPWGDSCAVRVRLAEQRTYTVLPVALDIVPDAPVVQLNPLTRTVVPGAGETVNLQDMVQWQGGRQGDAAKLRWQVGGGSRAFEVTSTGAQLQVQARADATPGAQETLSVSVAGAGESQSLLTLRVGEAATDAPQGGTVALQCTVGAPCETSLVGVPGEHDPFAGKSGGGLKLVSVEGGSCTVGTFTTAGDSLRVTWADARGAGGRCTATFTIRDAQHRVGTGTIELDAQGVPRAPLGVTPVGANADSVTLSVALSGEASHPAVTGVKLLTAGGAVGNCSLAGSQATCSVRGLTPGERATYTAVAMNSVGDSAQSANGVETWAYVPPAPPAISGGTPIEWSENQNPDVGKVRISVGQSPAATRVLVIDGVEMPVASDQTYVLRADGRKRDVSVYALDASNMIPPAYVGGGRGSAAHLDDVVPIGAPVAGTATLTLEGGQRTNWSIATDGWQARGGGSLAFTYEIGGYTGTKSSGGGLTQHESYTGSVTAATPYGKAGPVRTNTETSGVQLATIDGTYDTSTEATVSGNEVLYGPLAITYSKTPQGEVVMTPNAITPEQPTASVVQCAAGGVNCSQPGTVKPAGLAPLRMTLKSCVPWNGSDLPSHSQVAQHFNVVGAPGGTFGLVAQTDRSVLIEWGGLRSDVTIQNALCAPAP